MSELRHNPKVPNFMPNYTEEEKALAREKQREDADRKKKTRRNKVLASVAGGAILLTGGLAGKALAGGESKATEPKAEPSVSAPAIPGETVTEQNDFSLSAEAYTNNPEQLMTDFVENFNSWQNTGYTPEAAKSPDRFTAPDDIAYAAQLNADSDTKFQSQVLVDGWENNPSLGQWYTTSTEIHATNTAVALVTGDGSNSGDKEPYQRLVNLDPGSIVVESSSPDMIIVSATWTGQDNRDQNRAEDVITNFDPNQESGSYTLTFQKVGSELRLTDFNSENS